MLSESDEWPLCYSAIFGPRQWPASFQRPDWPAGDVVPVVAAVPPSSWNESGSQSTTTTSFTASFLVLPSFFLPSFSLTDGVSPGQRAVNRTQAQKRKGRMEGRKKERRVQKWRALWRWPTAGLKVCALLRSDNDRPNDIVKTWSFQQVAVESKENAVPHWVPSTVEKKQTKITAADWSRKKVFCRCFGNQSVVFCLFLMEQSASEAPRSRRTDRSNSIDQ